MTKTHCDWCNVIIPAGKRGEFTRHYVIDSQIPEHGSAYRLVVSVEQDGHALELCVPCYVKACDYRGGGMFP